MDIPTLLQNAEVIYQSLVDNGLQENEYIQLNSAFKAEDEEALEELSDLLVRKYNFSDAKMSEYEGAFYIDATSEKFPITLDNLRCFLVELSNQGTNFDTELVDYGSFIPEVKSFLEVTPALEQEYIETAFEASENENYSKGVIYANAALACNDKNPMSYYAKGYFKYLLGLPGLAIEDYTKSLELKPDEIETLQNRGAAYDSVGKFSEAIQDYSATLQLDPDNLLSLENRGNSKYNLKDFEGAKADWLRAQELGSLDVAERLKMLEEQQA